MLNVDAYVNKAIREIEEEQPWPGYYLIRSLEVEHLLRAVKSDDLGKVLDLGCGNGFVSCLISSIAKKVIAADLYLKDARTHTIGLDSAKRLLAKIDGKNVSLLACSMGDIPFKDDTFDTVVSFYTLHYLKGKHAALKEMKRVVKKEGMVILVVPNFLERIYAFFQFYLYFLVKSLKAAERMFSRNKSAGSRKKAVSLNLAKLRQNYKYFPFPGPHGNYRNSAVEMFRHMPVQWNNEFREAGFQINRSLTTAFAPYPLLLTLSLKIARIGSRLFERFTGACGDKPLFKYLGYNYCVILKK